MKNSLLLTFLLFCTSFNLFAAPQKILILGDSLTEGYGVGKTSAYPAQLEKLLKKNKKDIRVINAGISGSTSASATSRLKWLLKSKPEFLILALGANDGLRGVNLDQTKKNLASAIELARKNNVKVIIAGMLLPLNYGKKYRSKFSKMFVDLANEYKTLRIPFLLDGVGGVKEHNLADGIHPNEKGHKVIAKTIAVFIKDKL